MTDAKDDAPDDYFGFDYDDDERDDPGELAAAYQEIRDRCDAAKIEHETVESVDESNRLVVRLRNGRATRSISLYNLARAKSFLKIEFESWVYLGSFDAICNYDSGVVEARLQPHIPIPIRSIWRRLVSVGADAEPGDKTSEKTINLESGNEGLSVEIGTASREFRALSNRGFVSRHNSKVLRINGSSKTTHDATLELLSRVADALCFQIDLATNVPLSIAKVRRPQRNLRAIRPDEVGDLGFPTTEFDPAPMSLYWYGRGATGMPLLQFLAYYQVLEFYFPTYSAEEARRKVRNVLKDPTFRVDRDTDIGRVLSAMSGAGRSRESEISQLRATVNACVDPEELRAFLCQDDARKEFFSNKQKGLTDIRINLDRGDVDVRSLVTDLVYDIRCKIVHTKGEADGEIELLLPFSKESELLAHDNQLMVFLARKVLVAASSPIRL